VSHFSEDSAKLKLSVIEEAWNSADPKRIARLFCQDARILNKGQLIQGQEGILRFLESRACKDRHCRMDMSMWSFASLRISSSFRSVWQDVVRQQWYETEGNLQMVFDEEGAIQKLSITSLDIPSQSPIETNNFT